MIDNRTRILALAGSSLAMLAQAGPAFAQAQSPASDSRSEVPESSGIAVITVTAQKRAQAVNDVPMSISAIGNQELTNQGVQSPNDLARLVPGMTFTQTAYATPVYTIRGIGVYESSLAVSPAVSLYVDEVSLPFPAMSAGATLDLERVEVLKGPQGTLFGQNSTGGAINFVAAKPTSEFAIGVKGSYSRFDLFNLEGFVSGPVAENFKVRLAVATDQGGAWQRSITRPSDVIGDRNFFNGRLSTDWQASDRLRVQMSLSGWRDHSDTPVAQLSALTPQVPAALPAVTANSPLAPEKATAADWTPGLDLRKKDYFYQGALRLDYDLADAVTLTSLTSYGHYNSDSLHDDDGTAARDVAVATKGYVKSFGQELRLTGSGERLQWIIGGNYGKDSSRDQQIFFLADSSTNSLFGIPITASGSFARLKIESYAVFANAEYKIGENLRVNGGARYTHTRRDFTGCTFDGGDGNLATIFNILQGALKTNPATGQLVRPVVPIAAGGCYTLDANFDPVLVTGTLPEDNVSWRVGLDYRLQSDALLYANVSRGFKAGSFTTVGATNARQYDPVPQEKITAYEAGFKVPLAGRTVQLNGAAFYYDYRKKQIRGKLTDQIFGLLDTIVSVPKSRVIGAELQLQAQPMAGLDLNVAATFLDSKVTEYTGFNNFQAIQSFEGSPFPYTPKFSMNAGIQYKWFMDSGMSAFVGANANYNSATNAFFHTSQTRSANGAQDFNLFKIKRYATLDLRVGVGGANDKWQIAAFGRNVTNAYYWNAVSQIQDVVVRYPGKPAVYGLSFSWNY